MSHLLIYLKVVWIWLMKLLGCESTKMSLLLVFELCHTTLPSTPNVINVRPTIYIAWKCITVYQAICAQG